MSSKPVAKRNIKTFEAEDDVNQMLEKAKEMGIKLGFLCNQSLRKYLISKGYGKASK